MVGGSEKGRCMNRGDKMTGWVMWKKDDEGERVFWAPVNRLVRDIRKAFIFQDRKFARRAIGDGYEIARVEKGVIVQESVGLGFEG